MEKINPVCPVCKNIGVKYSFTAKDYISGEEFSVCECSSCGSAIIGPRSSGKDISGYYSERYYGRRKSYVEKLINYGREISVGRITGVRAGGLSLLDVGCGNGTFLMSMRARGWAAEGTEIAPPEHLLEGSENFIHKGDLKDQNFPGKHFDVVTMWHSLEHLSDLGGYLSEIKRILKPGGILVIEVPNFQSYQSRMFGKDWFHLDAPRHLFHFSPDGIRMLLEGIGFSGVSVFRGSFIYEFFGYVQSILNFTTRRKNLLFDFLNHKASPVFIIKNHPSDFAVNIILLLPAILISAILFLVGALFRRNGIMGVSARS